MVVLSADRTARRGGVLVKRADDRVGIHELEAFLLRSSPPDELPDRPEAVGPVAVSDPAGVLEHRRAMPLRQGVELSLIHI